MFTGLDYFTLDGSKFIFLLRALHLLSLPIKLYKTQKHEWRIVVLEKGIVCPVCSNKAKRDPPMCCPCGPLCARAALEPGANNAKSRSRWV